MDTFIKVYIITYIIIFFLTAMVLPSYILYKRTGVNPITFGKGTESAHDYIGMVFKLIFLVIGIYGVCYSFIDVQKIDYLDREEINIIGIWLSLVSLALIIIAQRTMANSWRIGIDEKVKTDLVTTGVFKLIRNPIFTGMLLIQISLFLMIPAYFTAYLMVLSYIIINIQVRLEEEFLTRVHGKAYIEYKSKAGRFLPKWRK